AGTAGDPCVYDNDCSAGSPFCSSGSCRRRRDRRQLLRRHGRRSLRLRQRLLGGLALLLER
ncbi:MAG: hypothetical protein KC457_13335, partial [Myxococcales bacterium]|nr:hypothetical protein [Myxococcales bacterium]